MGYRGKVEAHGRARQLRAGGRTLADIAAELGVAKSSVAVWVRDVEFEPRPRRRARRRGPNVLQRRKAAEIATLDAEGAARFGRLSRQAFLAAGAALYAGEGAKRDGAVSFANSDATIMAFFCVWLREFFDIDETRLRVRLYLHEGLDLDAANAFWSAVTSIPVERFQSPFRAIADPSIRTTRHVYGCCHVRYASTTTHRAIMGLIRALLSCRGWSGVAQSAERWPVKPMVEGPSPSPGAPLSERDGRYEQHCADKDLGQLWRLSPGRAQGPVRPDAGSPAGQDAEKRPGPER